MGTIPPRRESFELCAGSNRVAAAICSSTPPISVADGRWWVLDDRAQASIGHRLCAGDPLVLSRAYPNLYNAMNVHRSAGSGAGWDVAREAPSLRWPPRPPMIRSSVDLLHRCPQSLRR